MRLQTCQLLKAASAKVNPWFQYPPAVFHGWVSPDDLELHEATGSWARLSRSAGFLMEPNLSDWQTPTHSCHRLTLSFGPLRPSAHSVTTGGGQQKRKQGKYETFPGFPGFTVIY